MLSKCLLHGNSFISAYFKLHVRWLPSLTPVTYLSKLQGIMSLIVSHGDEHYPETQVGQ
ncbi:Uncharacterised protein [Yersinia enterocolitica]|nr:Uncharacterised protein [Yersinia enterocolitica]